MNHLYLQLGRAIAGQCPQGFQQAVLKAAMEEEGADLSLICGEVISALSEAGRRDIETALAAVRDAQAAEDGKVWRRCTVTLTAGGGFRMDVDQ